MADQKFQKGDRVRKSPAFFEAMPMAQHRDRSGTITNPRPSPGRCYTVLWDGLKTKQTYAEEFLEPVP